MQHARTAPGAISDPPLVPARLRRRPGRHRRQFAAGGRRPRRRLAAENPLAPRQPHFPAKAKRVIYLFQAGAPSHLELFDNKPELTKRDGQLPPAELLKGYRAAFINPNSALLGPKFKFAKHGQCGMELSEVLPHTAKIADDICLIRTMQTEAVNHAPAQIMMNTGSQQFGRPSFGSWTLYGLGSESADLPGFVVLTSAKGTSGGASNYGCGFLPTMYGGMPFRSAGDPVLYLSNPPGIDAETQRASLDALNRLNDWRSQVDARSGNRRAHPELRDGVPPANQRAGTDGPGQEPKETLDSYGIKIAERSQLRPQLPARPAADRTGRAVRATVPRSLGPARQPDGGREAERPRHRPGQRRSGDRPEAARPARRHARHLGRRIRPHADGARRQRRPRPPQPLLQPVAGRRRHQGRLHARRDRRLRASTSRPTRSTSTI